MRNYVRHHDCNDEDEENGDIVAKLLDPFEQLEREFHWDEVAAIKPPPAFSGSQHNSEKIDSQTKTSKNSKDAKPSVPSRRNKSTEEAKDSSSRNSYKQVYTMSAKR